MAGEIIYINGIKVIVPEFVCKKCGCTELNFKYLASNKSIQMRCAGCSAWHGNYKYDSRTKEQIQRDKIAEWLSEQNSAGERKI